MKVLKSTQEKTTPLYELDLKDRKLLYVLSKNARIPLARVAQFIGLSRDAVHYRIERLKQASIIAGARALISLRKLGWQSYHIFFSLSSPNKESEDSFVKYLEQHPFVNAIIRYSGKCDFEVALMVRDLQQLNQILRDILSKAPIQEYEILPILKTYKSTVFPERFIKGLDLQINYKKNDSSFYKDLLHHHTSNEEYKPDKNDIELMRILSEQTELPLKEMGKRLNLSDDAIVYRIRKLIHSGFILEFRPVINYSALGLSIQAVLLNLNLNEEREQPFIRHIKEHENILWAVETLGKWNVLLYIITSSQEEFHKTMHELRQKFGSLIKHYEVLFAYEEYKYTYFPQGIASTPIERRKK